MSRLPNTIDEAESKTYFDTILEPNPPVESPAEWLDVDQRKYSIVATDDATPSPGSLSNTYAPSFATNTASPLSLASSYSTTTQSKKRYEFEITVPVTVRLPVEAFYHNYPVDALGRRRVMTTNLNYEGPVDLPETQIPSADEPTPTSYVRPVNPYSPTTAQYQPVAPSESVPLPRFAAELDADTPDAPLSDKQLGMNLPGETGGRAVTESVPQQTQPQLAKRPSEEEVMGHNWIKFHEKEHPHAALNDITTSQEGNAQRGSRWVILRSTLRNIGKKCRRSGTSKGKKAKKQKQS